MYCWRVCLQVLIFLLIVFWAGLCAKLTLDALAKRENDLRELARESESADDQKFNDDNSSRIMRYIHRSVIKAKTDQNRHLDLRQRLDIARHIVHLVAKESEAERNGELSLVDSLVPLPAISPGVIEAKGKVFKGFKFPPSLTTAKLRTGSC